MEGFAEIKNSIIYFKVGVNDKATEWSYDLAKGVTFSAYGFTEKYEYVLVEGHTPVIMQLIAEGKVTLYKYSVIVTGLWAATYGIVVDMVSSCFVKRENEEYAIKLPNFKKHPLDYLSDCEDLTHKLDLGLFQKADTFGCYQLL